MNAAVLTTRIFLMLFLVAQACDGLLTYVAVDAFGQSAEGNLLLATWMTLVGPESAIVGAKILASGCGVVLYCLGLHRVLLALTMFYGVAAIGPWLVTFQHIGLL